MAERTDDREDLVSRRTPASGAPDNGNLPKSEVIRQEIESTRASLDVKLDALQTKVRDVQTNVKQTFDLNHQVAQHPWGMFGASMGAGFALGLMFGGNGNSRDEHGWYDRARGMFDDARGAMSNQYWNRPDWREQSYQGFGGGQHASSGRGDIMDTLKLAAGAALTDLFRQTVRRYVPALGQQLDQIWNERGLTPTNVASRFIGHRGGPQAQQQGYQGAEMHAMNQPGQDSSQAYAGSAETGYSSQGSTSYGGTAPYAASDAAESLRQDYNPTMPTASEPAVRGEVSSRS